MKYINSKIQYVNKVNFRERPSDPICSYWTGGVSTGGVSTGVSGVGAGTVPLSFQSASPFLSRAKTMLIAISEEETQAPEDGKTCFNWVKITTTADTIAKIPPLVIFNTGFLRVPPSFQRAKNCLAL